jgi:sodium-dependent dicarboxylate transporter 2/3/5
MFILSVTGNNTKMILLGFIISGAFIAMWVTEMAAAAMLMPLAKSLLEEEEIKPLESNFGKALMIACAWGPVIGGASTPAGSGSNSLAIGFIRDMTGVTLSFVDWMAYGVPVMLVMIIPTWLTISLFFKPEMKHLKVSNEEILRRYKELPKLDHNQRVSIALFLLTIALWTLSPFLEKIMGIEIPISMPVILTATLFFVPGMSTIPWKEIEKDISWSGIILVVTGISLGMVLYNSGAAMWVSVAMLGRVATMTAIYQIFAVVLLISLLKVIFSSNTVTGTIIIPIMITLAQSVGINPLAIGIPAAITSSLAFILVTSSPTNLIPYSAGYFSIKDMAKAGLVLTLVGSVLIAVVIYLVGHGQGLY